METNEILKSFKVPPGEYRPAPFWVWNDAMTQDQIEEQLLEFKNLA